MKAPPLNRWVGILLALSTLAAHGEGELTASNVLVVYNDPGDLQTSDGYEVFAHYNTKRPGIRHLNLDDASLPIGRVGYADFKTKIRDKIRAHLQAEALETTVRVLVLTKGIPHQITDVNNGTVGNSGGASSTLLGESNATFASVDSELMLLWHDLDTGEADGDMDSHADNFVINPYFEKTNSILVSPMINVPGSVTFNSVDYLDDDDEVAFRYWTIDGADPSLDEGLLYLTARLDGDTVSDAKALIDRSEQIQLDRKSHAIVLDETFSADDTNFDLADYTDTAAALTPTWNNIAHEQTGTFLVGNLANLVASYPSSHLNVAHDPIAFLASFGANHPGGSHTNWVLTYNGQIPHGAIFNTYESFNGQQFGAQAPSSAEHGQVADWISIGGTFGIGHVWEPFTIGVAKNETLTNNFYNNGLTWVESAWSSIELISWQNTVVGDPLAKADFIDVPQVTLSLTGPDYTQEVLEQATSIHTITITANAPVVGDLDINLSFLGATLLDDFTTSIAGYSTGADAIVTITDGQTQTSFSLTIVDDTDSEGLEYLTISVAESSLDINQDGLGESYGSIYATASAIIPIADSPFDWWQANQFGEAVLPEADRDDDGLHNLWEYVLTSNPNLASTPGTTDALSALKTTIDGNELVFELPKSLPSDTRLILETTTTLQANSWTEVASRIANMLWAETAGADVEVDDTPLTHDEITVTTTEPLRGFRRFRVEVIPTP